MFNQKKSKLMQTKGQLMKSLNTAFSFAPPSILSLTICTSNRFLHSITASYYSAINFSNQVPLTIINWSAFFHPCFTDKSDLIVAVLFATYVLHICYISTNFHHVSGRLTESKKKNPRTEVLRFVISLNCNSLAR